LHTRAHTCIRNKNGWRRARERERERSWPSATRRGASGNRQNELTGKLKRQIHFSRRLLSLAIPANGYAFPLGSLSFFQLLIRARDRRRVFTRCGGALFFHDVIFNFSYSILNAPGARVPCQASSRRSKVSEKYFHSLRSRIYHSGRAAAAACYRIIGKSYSNSKGVLSRYDRPG